jgi:nitroreductase
MTTRLERPAVSSDLLPQLMKAVRRDDQHILLGPSPTSTAPRVTGRAREGLTFPSAPASMGAEEGSLSLRRVLAERRSERFYGPRPIDVADLSRALMEAVRSDQESFGGVSDALQPQIVVAANRVTGLPAGLYRFNPDRCSYTFLAPSSRTIVERMVLQVEYADAPCIVAVLGSLSRSLQRWGDHGERALNTRSAAACYTALLVANSLGLAGSVFAGFLPSGLSEHLAVDGFNLSQVFAVSLGHPAPQNPPAADPPPASWTQTSTPDETCTHPSKGTDHDREHP